MPTSVSKVRISEPFTAGSNSGFAVSFSALITSRASSRDRTTWIWLVTASGSIVLAGVFLSASARKNTFCRASSKSRASER